MKYQKYFFIFILLITIQTVISGCTENNLNSENPTITKEFLLKNAKVGMTESEITRLFGHEAFREFGDGSFVWIFDKVKNDFIYKPDLQKVAFEDIKKGNIEYQLYINVINNKAIMFSYFYKGDNNEIWNFEIHSDGSVNDAQAS
ncbi:hypothetical protein [Paenibacillus glycanilyticus]|uniref:Lipoprotein SmpA/OmlA domain-containing protein n=1 Tax=Paenibacillus glycanilyticus TaxID=126569 RepID=A0ABQ6GBL1_9BACL|nr:hypothetical protein [Paenibacillus glycanilyticus]GLX68037.1 hypothetical protein MU1_23820 [Paenibacillus glycanilyticus]